MQTAGRQVFVVAVLLFEHQVVSVTRVEGCGRWRWGLDCSCRDGACRAVRECDLYDYANGAACSLPPRERGTCLCVRASFRVRTVCQRLVDTEATGETEKERAGGDWLNGPPEGSFLFWCVAWWSRGCCGLSAVLRCGGAAPWSVWILRVWVVSGVCERQVQSTTRELKGHDHAVVVIIYTCWFELG